MIDSQHWLSTRDHNDWRMRAACAEIGHQPFFPEGTSWPRISYEPALKVCRSCPVQAECLEWALAADERYGVWGGKTPEERSAITGRKVSR